MSLWKIAWRSIQQRALASWLTGISMALGVALVVIVLVVHGVVARSFSTAAEGYHLIIGAKGGKLQLVLNTVFHLSEPIENVSYDYYKEFTEYEDAEGFAVRGKFVKYVDVVVPYCLGDRFKDFRVVGTTPDLFDKMIYGSTPTGDLTYKFAEGENFRREDFFSAVIGSVAAYKAGLKIGAEFSITHGLAEADDPDIHDEVPFKVVGILAPTGTPNDRAVFVNMEGFYLIPKHALGDKTAHAHDKEHKHEHEEHAEHHDHGLRRDNDGKLLPLPENQREVTTLLVLARDNLSAQYLQNVINEGNMAQAVSPLKEVESLFRGIVGVVQLLLLVLAVLVVIVAGIGVLVSIYNSMSDRSREIAVMRSLGAGRSTVMAIVLLESILLSLLGGLGGALVGHAAIGALSPFIVQHTGVSIGFFRFETLELVLIPGLIALAAVVGYLPAVTAYRTDVARALSAAP